jgi:hypothetical protein
MGKEEIKNDNLISIFPNPTNRNITINFPSETTQIQITNSLGQLIQTRKIFNETSLDFKLENIGIYFIQITTDKQIVTRKLIVTN